MVRQSFTGMLQVEQAVFASSDRGQVKGYQLVGQSTGVDSDDALELARWAPTQLPADASDRGIVSSWALPSGTVVVARTMCGGQEYSNRGGMHVVTSFLLLRPDQFQAFHCDGIAIAKTALALGHLKLPIDLHSNRLTRVGLPSHSLFLPIDPNVQNRRDAKLGFMSEVATLIKLSKRFAVSGLADPIDAAQAVIARMTIQERQRFSFTTGLSPSIRRPLQAHFYRCPDVVRQRAIESQEIVYLHGSPAKRQDSFVPADSGLGRPVEADPV